MMHGPLQGARVLHKAWGVFGGPGLAGGDFLVLDVHCL